MRNAFKILVGKPEWKRLLTRPRRSWGDNIKMDFKEMGRWMRIELIWIRAGTSECPCVNGSIKDKEFVYLNY
jgi:hypothetical protein